MKKKILIICIIVILVCSIALIIFANNHKKKDNEKYEYKPNECIKLNNVCSEEEIAKGIKVPIKVGENQFHNFYVISNDKKQMTLILDINTRDKVNWYGDYYKNFFGPVTSLQYLAMDTTNWKNIDYIESYSYDDFGYKYYLENCANDIETTDFGYECKIDGGIVSRGYLKYEIINGIGSTRFNPDLTLDFDSSLISSEKLRSRLITVEEISSINKGNLPQWMISGLEPNECYWTLSSSVSINTSYNEGAFAVCNVDGKPSVESLISKGEENFSSGIRPVIVVNKE